MPAKVICAWCDPIGAQAPDVTATICATHKVEQMKLVEELRKARQTNEQPK